MSGIEVLAPLLLVLPMAGFLFTALIGRRLGKQAHWIPVLAIVPCGSSPWASWSRS